MFPRKKKDGLKMISKNQRQLILNLIEKYGDLRETYGRNRPATTAPRRLSICRAHHQGAAWRKAAPVARVMFSARGSIQRTAWGATLAPLRKTYTYFF